MSSDSSGPSSTTKPLEQPRKALEERLESLIPPQSRAASPKARGSTAQTATRSMTPPKFHALKQSSMATSSKSQLPTVRWFGKQNPTFTTEPEEVEQANTERLEVSSALQQAIQEQLPIRPAQAHIRPFSGSLHHPLGPSSYLKSPPVMSSLAWSAFPSSYTSTGIEIASNLPILVSQCPPTRTSIDSLRTLRDRGMHTTAVASPVESFSNFNLSWFRRETKKDVDNMLDETDRAETVQKETDQIRRKYQSPHNPIVFCHGLLGFDSIQLGTSFAPVQVSHWRGIKEVLESNGAEVLITRVPATSSIDERAKVLDEKISEVYRGREVHLIGHSMGGLDCRYLTTHIKKSYKVLSITTIATPHRGSAFADHFIQTIGRDRLPSVISLLDLLPNGGGDGKAFESLTVDNMRVFNEETPDIAGVKYFSWGATYIPGLIDTWRWPHSVVLEKEGPNDGLVSVESSKWGTYLGTLENVGHLDLVGWINTARYKWAELTGKEIAFKPATFYLGIADHLARVVEGQAAGSSSVIRNEPMEGIDTSPVKQANDLQENDHIKKTENTADTRPKDTPRT